MLIKVDLRHASVVVAHNCDMSEANRKSLEEAILRTVQAWLRNKWLLDGKGKIDIVVRDDGV